MSDEFRFHMRIDNNKKIKNKNINFTVVKIIVSIVNAHFFWKE
jgi:hypothetical protein